MLIKLFKRRIWMFKKTVEKISFSPHEAFPFSQYLIDISDIFHLGLNLLVVCLLNTYEHSLNCHPSPRCNPLGHRRERVRGTRRLTFQTIMNTDDLYIASLQLKRRFLIFPCLFSSEYFVFLKNCYLRNRAEQFIRTPTLSKSNVFIYICICWFQTVSHLMLCLIPVSGCRRKVLRY